MGPSLCGTEGREGDAETVLFLLSRLQLSRCVQRIVGQPCQETTLPSHKSTHHLIAGSRHHLVSWEHAGVGGELFHTASWSLKPASHRHSPAAVQLHVNQFLDDASFSVGERERVRCCVQTTLCRLHPLLFQPRYKILCAAKEDEQLGPVHLVMTVMKMIMMMITMMRMILMMIVMIMMMIVMIM